MPISIHGTGTITGINQGIQISGVGTFTDNVSIGGTLTYEDVTNIDSIGIITARSGIVGDLTGNVTGNVTGDITGNLAGTTTLAGISSSISDTAVDIFIYDTSKDSDGGAWRKRTQHTSWYNETLNTATRGSRREFPAVAVITVQNAATNTDPMITIYDGDDPDLPMWMVFRTNISGGGNDQTTSTLYYAAGPYQNRKVAMLNGVMVDCQFRSSGHINGIVKGVTRFNFIDDSSIMMTDEGDFKRNGNLGDERNTVKSYTKISTTTIVHTQCNDVAMTVLPNAPIDSATGLPVPTIAVATDGGVSIIKDDGTVIDKATTSDPSYTVDWMSPSRLLATAPLYYGIFDDPFVDESGGYISNISNSSYYNGSGDGSSWNYPRPIAVLVNSTAQRVIATDSRTIIAATNSGLNVHELSISSGTDNNDGMVAYATTSYNTGWMHGDIKGAFLSDTDTTDAAPGSNLIPASSADFSSSSGWTLGTGWTISGGKLNKTTTDNVTAYYSFTGLTIGKAYTFSIDVDTVGSGTLYFYALGQYTIWPSLTTTGTHSLTVVANATSLDFGITAISGNGAVLDNASLTIGEADRSVNNKGLQVFGTITKSAVATGAELVAYSGFSGSNVLVQPYNSNLNPGTGNYSFMCWFKCPATTAEQILMRRFGVPTVTGGTMMRIVSSSSVIQWYVRDTSSTATAVNSTMALDDGNWHCAVGTREGSTAKLYIDGELNSTSGCSANSHDPGTTADLVIGAEEVSASPGTYQNPADLSSLTLVRYSLSAPSAAQVKKMYEDEKFLFQENAACTLYGSSDAVTALAYDEVTEQLHVGTSSGRSDFQGLRRINNTTTAVTTAISAHDEFIAEQ